MILALALCLEADCLLAPRSTCSPASQVGTARDELFVPGSREQSDLYERRNGKVQLVMDTRLLKPGRVDPTENYAKLRTSWLVRAERLKRTLTVGGRAPPGAR